VFAVGALPKKKELVEQLKKDVSGLTIALVLDYRGLTTAELTDIRRALYKNDAKLSVAKNTLLKRVVDGTEMAGLSEVLKGPTALAVGKADQIAPIKILTEYLKKNKKENEIRGGFMDGQLLDAKQVNDLANLPSLDELRGKLVGGIASPLNGIVAAISGPQRGLVNVLDQFAKHKQQSE